jgi:hypothetical protein
MPRTTEGGTPVNTPKAFDLADFDSLISSQEEGLDVEIVHPKTREPLGISIRIAGPDSKRQQDAVNRQIDARLRTQSAEPLTAEETRENNLRLLASSVITWSGVVLDGKPLDSTIDNAVLVFRRFPFIKEQVDAKAGNRAAFLTA